MNKFKKYFPSHLLFLIAIWLLLVAIFMFTRYAALYYIRPDLSGSAFVLRAFRVGARFDVQVACYGLLLPFFILFGAFFIDYQRKWLGQVIRIWCMLIVIVSLIICAADIPYFHFFNSRLTTAAVQWGTNLGQMFRFLLTAWNYYPFYIVGGLLIYATGRWVGSIWKKTHDIEPVEWSRPQKGTALVIGLVLLWLGCFGFRRPALITMSEAYCCPEGFLNQLALNPVHTWFNSTTQFHINYLKIEEAKRRVQAEFGIKKQAFPSPIAREIEAARGIRFSENRPKPNVVLILVESLSAAKMGVQGGPKILSPNLDSLALSPHSVFFENFFSVGIHTSNGLFGSLFGFPVMMSEHPMNSRSAQKTWFAGMPSTLRSLGWRTSFFCTHGKDFDGIEPFFQKNGFEMLVDKAFYPPEKQVGSWGIPDEVLLDGAFAKLDSMARDTFNRQPIFSTILTITSHPPYELPPFTRFRATTGDQVDATYQYADWALGQFFDSCATRPWYSNTIFVLCGDHGLNTRQTVFDVDMDYNHVPLILHAPGFFSKNEVKPAIGMQIDIFPTVMGLLGLPWINNTMGIDLFREKRPFAYFSQDSKMGVVDSEHLYVMRKSGTTSLYKWRTDDPTDLKKSQPELVRQMRDYGCSMMQISNWVIDRQLSGEQ